MAKRGSTPTWTDEQKATLMHLFNTTQMSYREIGEQLNRSQNSIYHMVRTLRLENQTKGSN